MTIPIPESCTLPTAARPLRLAEFDTLFTTAVHPPESLAPTRARLHLAATPDTVRDLAARETACCSFFTFTVTSQPGHVTLDIAVPPTRADVLAGLLARARSLAPAR